jgi:hypothetical protein
MMAAISEQPDEIERIRDRLTRFDRERLSGSLGPPNTGTCKNLLRLARYWEPQTTVDDFLDRFLTHCTSADRKMPIPKSWGWFVDQAKKGSWSV